MKFRSMLILSVIIVFAGSVALSSDILDKYTNALKMARSGHAAMAVEILEDILVKNPDDPLAEDVVFQIGQISERELVDYAKARDAYRKLIEGFPEGKHVRRAESALQRLEKMPAEDDAAIREYKKITLEYHKTGGKETLKRMEGFVNTHPHFIYSERAWLFIAQERSRLKEYRSSIQAYERLIKDFPSDENVHRALSEMGNAYVETRKLSAAEETYKRLKRHSAEKGMISSDADAGLKRVSELKMLRFVFFICLLVLALYLAFLFSGTDWRSVRWKSVLKIWPEAIILTLFSTVGYFGALTKGRIFTRGIILLWVSSIIFATCNHLYIQNRRTGKYNIVVFGSVALVASVALCFVVFHLTDLTNLLWDSLRYSMEYGE